MRKITVAVAVLIAAAITHAHGQMICNGGQAGSCAALPTGPISITTGTGVVSSVARLPVAQGGTNAASFIGSRCIQSAADGLSLTVAAAVCGSGGGAAWGSITGTLSNQTDLQTALDARQSLDTDLTAIAALVSAADRVPFATGAGTWSLATFTAAGRALIDDADAATQLVTLGLGTPTGTSNVVLANTPTLVTPIIGAATGTSLTTTGLIKSTGTAGVGYAAGAGGTVTQLTSKATGVTLNKISGQITMNAAALAAAAEVSFIVTNSTAAAGDTVIINHGSAGTAGAYVVQGHTISAGAFRIMVGNMSAGSLSEAIVLNFAIFKAVIN